MFQFYVLVSTVAAVAMYFVYAKSLLPLRKADDWLMLLAYALISSGSVLFVLMGFGSIEQVNIAFTAVLYAWVGGVFGLGLAINCRWARLAIEPQTDFAALGICPPLAPVHPGVGCGTYTTCRHRRVGGVERGNSTPSLE